jgi:pimeloyl-ACP methyl ester carboxylesterase
MPRKEDETEGVTMIRRWAILVMATGLLTASIQADDFGDFLKKAARDKLKKQFSDENLDRTFQPHEVNAEVYTVKTADGWTLVAHRYRPMGQPNGRMPVLLCHGLSYNAMFWDLDPPVSFAEYLSWQGYDVWSVSLRGCGLSQKWVWKLDSAPTMVVGGAVRRLTGGKLAPTGYATVDPQYANWTMDQHIAHDVPAFLHLVKHHTGAKEVAWVGHSMGGIIALAYLSRYENAGIGKLVTVGSQVTMPDGQLFLNFAYEMIKTRQGQLVGKIDKQQLAADVHTSVNNMFFNEKHVSPKVYEALCTWANDTPAINLLQQYMHLAKTGELFDGEKQFNYAKAMGNVKVPILITGGEADQLAPPGVQKYLHDHVGSAGKSLVIFGRSQGFSVNAGHNDALVGLTSRQQFYPVIERWLRTGK